METKKAVELAVAGLAPRRVLRLNAEARTVDSICAPWCGLPMARRYIIVDWSARPLRHPCALAEAGIALTTPHATAAGATETAGATGPLATSLHRHPDRPVRRDAALNLCLATGIHHRSVDDLQTITNAWRAGAATSRDHHAPVAVIGRARAHSIYSFC